MVYCIFPGNKLDISAAKVTFWLAAPKKLARSSKECFYVGGGAVFVSWRGV